jgi:hypothetical protein
LTLGNEWFAIENMLLDFAEANLFVETACALPVIRIGKESKVQFADRLTTRFGPLLRSIASKQPFQNMHKNAYLSEERITSQ